MIRINLLRITLVVLPAIYFCSRLWANTSNGLNWIITCDCFFFLKIRSNCNEYSSLFLMVGTSKYFLNLNLGGEGGITKSGWNLQFNKYWKCFWFSFLFFLYLIEARNNIQNNICGNDKYLPTTEYIAITLTPSVQENFSVQRYRRILFNKVEQ